MDRREYLQYLKSLVGDKSAGEWSDENTSGLFQHFRPAGNGVEQVFAPIPEGRRYSERMLPVYRVTSSEEYGKDGYFVVRSATAYAPQALGTHAMALVNNLKALAEIIGDPELRQATGDLSRVAHRDLTTKDFETDEFLTVYEVVGDWLGGLRNYTDLIPVLREAYYSISCDYWLANYLQWPYYERHCALDAFAPYFELWRLGIACSFQADTILVGKRA